MLHKFSRMNSPVKIWTKVGEGENTGEQKGDQAKRKALEIYLRKFYRNSNTSNTSI